MQPECVDQKRSLTTGEVAALTGRTAGAVRAAITRGDLPAARIDGRRYVSREEALAWQATYQPTQARHVSSEPWERAAELLGFYYSLSARELAEAAGIHEGNARKHLDQLHRRGRAERRSDGQWVLTATSQQQGAA